MDVGCVPARDATGVRFRFIEVSMKKIAPSILSADFSRLGEEVRAVEEAGADVIHVDVMDGHFVPNITIGPLVVEGLKKLTSLPLDVHLMIEKPERYIEPFAQAGSTWLTFHAEVCSRLRSVIKKVRELNVRPGVVLNPSTPLKTLYPILEEIDLVLLMSVNPGFAGQSFIPATLKKIERSEKDHRSKPLSPGDRSGRRDQSREYRRGFQSRWEISSSWAQGSSKPKTTGKRSVN